jgi:transposase
MTRSSAAAVSGRTLSPPDVAKRFGIGVGKVHQWIKAGELGALNIASTTASRPVYAITETALAAFEQARAIKPAPRRRARTIPATQTA